MTASPKGAQRAEGERRGLPGPLARCPQDGPKRALAALIFALAFALFWPAREHAWLNYDDDVYITDRKSVV